MKNLIVRAITGVFFVTAVVTCFLSPIAMIFLFALVTGLTTWEFTGIVNTMKTVSVNRFISTVGGVYLFLAMAGYVSGFVPTSAVFVPYLLTVVYLFVSELYTRAENPIDNWAYTMLSQMYIALPFSTLNALAFMQQGDGTVAFSTILPLSVFIFLWVSDTGAYCCGSLFGKHKLFPRVSPAKSWEGSIGGGVFVLIAAAAVWYFTGGSAGGSILSLPVWLGLGLVVVVFGTLGDLVESLFKRTVGIKDSGNILPGHGGMLDRFDSSLMALPAALVYLYSVTML
ncbi:MAG: phosphatidate cytidylyltransferase [Prevotella sp.]|uniref:phosphatidate cytidylyltransferase n=1 Tax=Prevotella sp. TaxID=59823 RepID=UPI002A25C888|nr:phosphatidate cytidylyltransferase [Prevotella sp.]MDD7319064.1 phosphatidate cytidylyltransferase [Prevotellaceae bacterium]MDY4020292.1 phosphatidate cytidylyltransferase [Prevotella sp.]